MIIVVTRVTRNSCATRFFKNYVQRDDRKKDEKNSLKKKMEILFSNYHAQYFMIK